MYASRGWAVFPLDGTRPFSGTHGHRDATVDAHQLKRWWRKWPDANVGIACDSTRGPIVVDVDGPEGELFVSKLSLPPTREATSGRPHRRHFYFDPAKSGILVRRTIGVRPSLDILGDGGYVVAPPSVKEKNGKEYTYRWLAKPPLAPLPPSILKLMGNHERKAPAAPLPAIIAEGRRDELLTSLAGSMRRRGASEDAILAALLEENATRCRPPLPEKQLEKIARSIARKAPAGHDEHLTDLGNARRFVEQHREDLRNVRVWRRPWLIFDGTRWAPDETGEAERLAKGTVRMLYQEAAHIGDPDSREALLKHAGKSEAAPRVRALLDLAATEPEVAMTSDAFDADEWQLNVENGTLDLRTGELKPHRREDLVTKLAPVEFNAKAKAPRWERFLHEIMPDNELIDFVQRAIGYSLTGDTREECLFFCYGRGANGKSKFLETIRHVLGDYAQQADFGTFQTRRGEGPRNDLARMRGARLISAVEAQGDRGFDETVLKQLTGNDTVVARRLYEEFEEFKPAHKIWLAANHKPVIKEQTEALWRRIRMVPFTVTIPTEQRDKKLGAKLALEASGILNWALAGCRKWRKEGLGAPTAVVKATKAYREEHDVLGEFLAAKAALDPKAWTSTADLYQAFVGWWAETRGPRSQPFTNTWMGRALGEREDARPSKQHHARGWRGIALKLELS